MFSRQRATCRFFLREIYCHWHKLTVPTAPQRCFLFDRTRLVAVAARHNRLLSSGFASLRQLTTVFLRCPKASVCDSACWSSRCSRSLTTTKRIRSRVFDTAAHQLGYKLCGLCREFRRFRRSLSGDLRYWVPVSAGRKYAEKLPVESTVVGRRQAVIIGWA